MITILFPHLYLLYTGLHGKKLLITNALRSSVKLNTGVFSRQIKIKRESKYIFIAISLHVKETKQKQ